MATLLSKKIQPDIANYIYYIALNEFLQQKIAIFTNNLEIIFEKHYDYIKNDKENYNIYYLLNNDVNQVLNTLKFNTENFINPYKKWNISYTSELTSQIQTWKLNLLKFNHKYKQKLKHSDLEYKLLNVLEIQINNVF